MDKQNKQKLNKYTDNLIKVCNRILVNREDKCQCYNDDNHPSKNIRDCVKMKNSRKCRNYNKCKLIYNEFLSGSEPDYRPDKWADPIIEGSHNCYAYFLDDKIPYLKKKCLSICKKKHSNRKCRTNRNAVNNCGNLKPQPGNYADQFDIKNFKRNRKYTCPQMIKKIKIDSYKKRDGKRHPKNGSTIYGPVDFDEPCKKNYYKGGMTVDRGNTFHFYRQDSNGRYSHKQGTLKVENIDASNSPIYAPHLSDRNYKKKKKKGIVYNDWCGYFCLPKNSWLPTHAIGGYKQTKKNNNLNITNSPTNFDNKTY